MEITQDGKKYCKCEQCEKFATFSNAVKLGWDWFTGRLPRVHHYCSLHKNSSSRNATFRLSGLR